MATGSSQGVGRVRANFLSPISRPSANDPSLSSLRCSIVTKSIVLRILGAVLFLVSAGSLIAVAAISLRLKMDSTIALDDLHRCVCIGLCIALATDVYCALVLCYELIYKRRKSLAKSTLIQQFLVVALQSSLLTSASLLPFP